MTENPVSSVEFYSGMENLKESITKIEVQDEKRFNAIDRRIDGLYSLHQECALRREARAFLAGVENEKLAAQSLRIALLEEDKKGNTVFRRAVVSGVIVSVFSAALAI